MAEAYAHTRLGMPPETWQPLVDHHRAVAELAGQFAARFGAKEWARCAGLLHDLGKMRPAFQAYLFRENGLRHPEHDHAYIGKSSHADAGARLVWASLGKAEGAILSNLIAGHHAGLYDTADLEQHILKQDRPSDNALFSPARATLQAPAKIGISPRKDRFGFQLAFFVRMLFSCLVDADYLDTEGFCSPERTAARSGAATIPELLKRFDAQIAALQNAADPTLPVNACRREILDHCLSASAQTPGLFSLTVPTGGGKTLSSLAFALQHAARYGKDRVIYVIPYTSNIEQNADVFRRFLGDDAVLEHHASFDFGGDDDRNKLASENWDAPLVITTTAQFFDSLFSNRPSKCRKLHNLANSVIIFDEVQALPVKELLPCMAAMQEVADNYGASVVLCSATQPGITQRKGFEDGLEHVREIVPEPQRYFDRLRRTRITVKSEPQSAADIAAVFRTEPQMLAVFNTRTQARDAFGALRGTEGAFHLSALMCPAHRRAALAEIRERLRTGAPCRVVSTQVIEAGVDVDFPVVWRAFAGLDSIAQAAGRCNREGRRPCGAVTVFRPEGKDSKGDFNRREAATKATLLKHKNDLLQPEAIAAYFDAYYFYSRDAMDSLRLVHRDDDARARCCFLFEEEAKFALIDSTMDGILIPWDAEADALASQIRAQGAHRGVMRRAQQYSVQVYRWELEKLTEAGAVELIAEGVRMLKNMRLYDRETGLATSGELWMDAGQLVV